MRNTEKLRVLNELYDEVYSRYEAVNEQWKEAFEVDNYQWMRETSCKRGAYLDVMTLLTHKMKEA